MDKEEIREDLKKLKLYQQLNNIESEDFWENISWKYKLNPWFIKKYKDYLDIRSIVQTQEIGGNIEIIEDKLTDPDLWRCLVINQVLSNEELEKYVDNLPIEDLVRNQKLSDEFLVKNKNRFNNSKIWESISSYQMLSPNIISYFISELDRDSLIMSQRITKELRDILHITERDNTLLKKNYLHKTDLGKDYFISFYSTSKFTYTNFYFPTYVAFSDGKGLFYYKDMITTGCSVKILSLKHWSCDSINNIYKRI